MVPQFGQRPLLQAPAVGPVPHEAPGAMQLPPKQHPPPPQAPLAQQGSPGSPHLLQYPVLGLQTVSPLVQAFPGWQHISPAPPQAAQVPPRQRVFPAVHVDPEQQGWPRPPHVPQVPLLQVPAMIPQPAPEATHTLATQQPPCAHTFPGQQAPPGVPHAASAGLAGASMTRGTSGATAPSRVPPVPPAAPPPCPPALPPAAPSDVPPSPTLSPPPQLAATSTSITVEASAGAPVERSKRNRVERTSLITGASSNTQAVPGSAETEPGRIFSRRGRSS